MLLAGAEALGVKVLGGNPILLMLQVLQVQALLVQLQLVHQQSPPSQVFLQQGQLALSRSPRERVLPFPLRVLKALGLSVQLPLQVVQVSASQVWKPLGLLVQLRLALKILSLLQACREIVVLVQLRLQEVL
jgi:hypothetical protein